MRLALKDAGIQPGEVGYINAHATSTMADAIETRAMKTVFGEAIGRIPISATKSMTGHLLGAAGGSKRSSAFLPSGTAFFPDDQPRQSRSPLRSRLRPHQARKADVNVALSNSFGFGGTNATIIFRKYQEN